MFHSAGSSTFSGTYPTSPALPFQSKINKYAMIFKEWQKTEAKINMVSYFTLFTCVNFCCKNMVICKSNQFLRLSLKQHMDTVIHSVTSSLLLLLWKVMGVWLTAQVNAVLGFTAPIWLWLALILDTRKTLIVNLIVDWKMICILVKLKVGSESQLPCTHSISPFQSEQKVNIFLLCALKKNFELKTL